MSANRKYFEVTRFVDDGDKVEFLVHYWSLGIVSYLEAALKQLNFPYKLSYKDDFLKSFIFRRKDFYKVVSKHTEVGTSIKLVKQDPFVWLEIRGQKKEDIKSSIPIKPLVFLCPTCGYQTDDLSLLHQDDENGSYYAYHRCPNCGENTDTSEPNESDEHHIIYLKSSDDIEVNNCAICRGSEREE